MDELQAGQKMDRESIEAMVKERLDAELAAEALGLENYAKLDMPALKALIVKTASPEVKVDEVNEDYLNGRYDMVLEKLRTESNSKDSLAKLRGVIQGDAKKFFKRDESKKLSPREQLHADTENMWRPNADKKSA